MPRARTKTTTKRSRKDLEPQTRRVIFGIVSLAAGVLLFLSLQNQAGTFGNSINAAVRILFGSWGMIFPLFLVCSGIFRILSDRQLGYKKNIGLVLCLVSFLGLVHIQAPLEQIGPRQQELGGAIGFMVSLPFLLFFSREVGDTILVTDKGEPLWNTSVLPNGKYQLVNKATGEVFTFIPVIGSGCTQNGQDQSSAYCHECHAVKR